MKIIISVKHCNNKKEFNLNSTIIVQTEACRLEKKNTHLPSKLMGFFPKS